MMNEIPSVTRTWPSAFPAKARRMKRSINPPNTATSRPPSSAAIHRFGMYLRMLTPKYAPSMNSDPWVRLAIRIRPKISEKPAASRNSSPPRARLFSVWTIQNCMRLFRQLPPFPSCRRGVREGLSASLSSTTVPDFSPAASRASTRDSSGTPRACRSRTG